MAENVEVINDVNDAEGSGGGGGKNPAEVVDEIEAEERREREERRKQREPAVVFKDAVDVSIKINHPILFLCGEIVKYVSLVLVAHSAFPF